MKDSGSSGVGTEEGASRRRTFPLQRPRYRWAFAAAQDFLFQDQTPCDIVGVVHRSRKVKIVCSGRRQTHHCRGTHTLVPQRKIQRNFGDTLARSTAVQRAGTLDSYWGSASSIAWQHVGSTDERKSISADSIHLLG